MRYTVQSRAPATLPVAAVLPRGWLQLDKECKQRRFTVLQFTVLQGLCNLAAPTRLSRPRREDCYVAVRRASIHTEAICITGPALPCPYTQTKGHYLRTMPLVWHNERSSRVAFQAALESKWCRKLAVRPSLVPAPAHCYSLFAGKTQWYWSATILGYFNY